ncbi:branched-chain amino acid ABC transporter permease/ATP-binding protein [Aeromicrobium ginsengisoli]|uniref:ATP-binding cassette domain-containing protein n=1 Tax=Aeromicrobium ginsengisoli TaxID=363867 RepID=A0A5M4F998_9ACTN|nr:branched-chain amino acid ABC transporter permease/ATP-binding protein [Aeromicrobium ginsengisoli]KAA1394216.1 ATP-binding cassette domain-containing protein [Aeromicrobium ginsengisoli]
MNELLTFALIGLGTGAINVILATGLVMVYRGSGIINFAQGGLAILGAYTVFELRTVYEASFAVALVTAVVLVAAVGVAVHFLVMRPLRAAGPMSRVIATLGVLTIVTQVIILKYGAEQRTVPLPLPSDAVEVRSGVIVGEQNLYLAGIAVVLIVALTLLSEKTRIGHALSAAAEDPRAAAALGWSPDLLASLTWGLGGALAGLAGALFPATSTGFMSVTQMSVLIIGGLSTALLGQFRSFPLVLVGGLLIGVAQSLATRYVDQTGFADAIPFLIIIVVLIVRGRGLPVRGSATDRLPRVGNGRLRPVVLVPVVAGGLAFLALAAPESWFPALIVSMTFAIVGLSVLVLTGYAGQLSFAQFAIGGVGAFVAGRLVAARDWPLEAALPTGVLVATLVGLLFGLPALRTRGVNLAVVTFGLGFALFQLLFSNSSYTGGAEQTQINEPTLFGIDIDPITHADHYTILCFVTLVALAIMVANLRRGRAGRRLLAVRTNERAAAAAGVSVFQGKLYAFTLAAAIAGIGGVLLGFSYSTIVYQQLFRPDASISLLVLVVIGGSGYVFGPMIGALLAAGGVAVLPFGDAATNGESEIIAYLPLATGILLLATLLLNQHGIVDRMSAMTTAALGRLRRTDDATGPVADAPDDERQQMTVPPLVLEIEGLTQQFGGFMALSDVSLSLRPGEVVGLLGPNGAGKTTLIDAVSGFNRITRGRVSLGEDDITTWSPHRRSRAGVTRSFQSLELFDDLTVEENLLVASDKHDARAYVTDLVRPGRPVMSDTVVAAVTELRLAGLLGRHPVELSYGDRRLVAIARAVAGRPSVLLLDEPAAGLDTTERLELGHLIRRLADDWGIAVLLIEHDVPMVLRTADRVVVLDFGRIIAEGTPEAIKHNAAVHAAYLGHSAQSESESV